MRLGWLLAFVIATSAAGSGEFVRVSPRDPRYFELTDATPYIPIGLNMIAPRAEVADPEGGLRVMDDWLRKLSANGGNYVRLWLSSPFWDVEHEKSGVYDARKAERIDRVLALCRKYGIRVKITIEHFRTIDEPGKSWAHKPLHHVSRGGPATGIADFFDGEKSRAQFRGKIRWYRDRYGDDPIIFGWELWNEINAVRGGDYMAWTRAMLPELHRAFPKNLAMQSLGSFDRANKRVQYRELSTMEGNDVAQVHRYLDLGAELEICKGPVDALAADAVRELLGYEPNRPIVLAETGAVEPNHAGPFKLYAADKSGIILHDALFGAFFAGAAGPGQIWHWGEYVDANNLWHHYGRFAEAVRGLDPPAEHFEALTVDHERLRVYALRGDRTVLVWCRDKESNWMTELRDGRKPEVVTGAVLDLAGLLSGRTPKQVRLYDPWTARWSDAEPSANIALPDFTRSIVARLAM